MTNPISQSFVPSQQQSVNPTPNRGEFYPWDWQYKIGLDAPEFNGGVPPEIQSDNFRDLMEPHKNLKINMFNPIIGHEPIYGHREDFLNPLDQNQTNRVVEDIYKVTRVQDNRGLRANIKGYPGLYPVPATYLTYEGSVAPKRSLGSIFQNQPTRLIGQF